MKNKLVVDDVREFVGNDGDEYPEKIIAFYWHNDSDHGEYVLNYWKDGRITANSMMKDFRNDKLMFLKSLISSAGNDYGIELDRVDVKN